MNTFSQRLKQLRTDAGKNQIDIAKHIGVSVQSYSAYETGREPKYELLCKLADYFNCTVDYLLGRNEVRSPDIEDIAINERFELSPNAIKNLESGFDNVLNYKTTIDKIVSNENFPFLVTHFSRLIEARRKYSTASNYFTGTVEAMFAGTVFKGKLQEVFDALPKELQKELDCVLGELTENVASPEDMINSYRRSLDDTFSELVKDIMLRELNSHAKTQN